MINLEKLLARNRRVDENVLYEVIGNSEADYNSFGHFLVGSVEFDIAKRIVERYLRYTFEKIMADTSEDARYING